MPEQSRDEVLRRLEEESERLFMDEVERRLTSSFPGLAILWNDESDERARGRPSVRITLKGGHSGETVGQLLKRMKSE